MSALKVGEISADFIFISDVHLVDLQSRRGQLLLEFIDRCIAGEVKFFVLGGDIFEFFWARSSYFETKFKRLWEGLEALSSSGTDVYFVQGNHEYCMEEKIWKGVKLVEADGATIEVRSGPVEMRIGFSHGDLLNAPKSYLRFKSILNSGWFKFLFDLIPSSLSDSLALALARKSRKNNSDSILPHRDILNAAFNRGANMREDVHIFGHFHYPYQSKNSNGKMVICVPSWDIPNAVILNGGTFSRLNLSGKELSSAPLKFSVN